MLWPVRKIDPAAYKGLPMPETLWQ